MVIDYDYICLALGILLGMFYYQKTGLACGGIITPAFIALHIQSPLSLLFSLGAGFATYLMLLLLVHFSGLYGRQRLATAMLIALFFRWSLSQYWIESSLWLGWVIPGLIGADMQRQGVVTTLTATISTGIATAMAARLIMIYAG